MKTELKGALLQQTTQLMDIQLPVNPSMDWTWVWQAGLVAILGVSILLGVWQLRRFSTWWQMRTSLQQLAIALSNEVADGNSIALKLYFWWQQGRQKGWFAGLNWEEALQQACFSKQKVSHETLRNWGGELQQAMPPWYQVLWFESVQKLKSLRGQYGE